MKPNNLETNATSCSCENKCDMPKKNNNNAKRKGILGLMAAMAICCITPLAIGFFASGVIMTSLLAWVNSPVVYLGIAAAIGVAMLVYFKKASTNIKP